MRLVHISFFFSKIICLLAKMRQHDNGKRLLFGLQIFIAFMSYFFSTEWQWCCWLLAAVMMENVITLYFYVGVKEQELHRSLLAIHFKLKFFHLIKFILRQPFSGTATINARSLLFSVSHNGDSSSSDNRIEQHYYCKFHGEIFALRFIIIINGVLSSQKRAHTH